MASGLEPIQTYTIASATPSVTFTNIPQTFTSLLLFYSGFASLASRNVLLQANGDATNGNYSTYYLYGASGSNATAALVTSGASGDYFGGTLLESSYGSGMIYIQNYKASTPKFAIGRSAQAASALDIRSSAWRGTSAITSLNVSAGGANWGVGSVITLYGFKGA